MKKLNILALTMLLSTSAVIMQASGQQTLREKLAGHLTSEQQDKIAAARQKLATQHPNFTSMTPAEKRAALATKFPNQAAAVSSFKGMTQDEKRAAILNKYQDRSGEGKNIFTGNTVNRAESRQSSGGSDNLGGGQEANLASYTPPTSGSGNDYSGYDSGDYSGYDYGSEQ